MYPVPYLTTLPPYHLTHSFPSFPPAWGHDTPTPAPTPTAELNQCCTPQPQSWTSKLPDFRLINHLHALKSLPSGCVPDDAGFNTSKPPPYRYLLVITHKTTNRLPWHAWLPSVTRETKCFTQIAKVFE
ncbi:hypothetical protein CNYM01_02030 [Colletotrichum nymphaeae SA-01]|uniref:Uncharacterized protein n=1 Tax=Colletotrichum nymphaeae SA-01 TaxID=1460502 RepID=A0A135UWC7_9PEZI|nr:hypothetical protein CNYM01_02030 [Colletotrichum nymphaeae SA-01]